jgi:hypothetical protein
MVVAEDTTPRLRAEGLAAGFPAAARAEAFPVAATITANDFHPESPLTSLTVRRLRKEPPVLPMMGEGNGGC